MKSGESGQDLALLDIPMLFGVFTEFLLIWYHVATALAQPALESAIMAAHERLLTKRRLYVDKQGPRPLAASIKAVT